MQEKSVTAEVRSGFERMVLNTDFYAAFSATLLFNNTEMTLVFGETEKW